MAHLRVYIEEGSTEGPPVAAWLLDLPGAYATGQTRAEALEGVVGEVRDYWRWLRKHGEIAPTDDDSIGVEVVETFQMFRSSPNYEVNAFFAPDALAITEEDIPRYLWLLEASRKELKELLARVPPHALDWKRDDRTRTIREILRHIAWTELWYLGRLLSDDPLAMLQEARAIAVEHLRQLEAAQRERVTIHAGEKWSARKVFRRFLYHERYHTKSVRGILQAYRRAHG